MNRKTRISLLATLGICMLSFMPAVLGTADSRPISDFVDTNDYTGVAAWVDPETNLIIFPHGFYVTPPGTNLISDCEHHGSVLERDLKDGRIMYRINLHVKGAYMLVGDYGVNPFVFEGEMDYSFTCIIIVEGEMGGPVPNLIDVWFYGAGEAPYSHLTGSGTGTFLVDAFGFSAGDTANVKVNQIGLTKPEGHPFYPGLWPVELVFLH
ncbi:MAG: hypothetical protein ACFFAV_10590 [Candidatus Hermodarchaeota archaeon]